MKILITGSSGYVGYIITTYFSEKGIEVIGLDIQRNKAWKGNKQFTFFKCDVRDKHNSTQSLKQHNQHM